MGTRGFVGFVVDSVEHITYNHMSSGPDWLGTEVLRDLRTLVKTTSPQALREQAARLFAPIESGLSVRQVAATNPAFAAIVAEHTAAGSGPRDRTLDDSDEETWRWWLGFEGVVEWLHVGLYDANPHFPLYSGHCEWGYLIDLDRSNGPDRAPGVLEVYVGFQRSVPKAGRWANRREMAEDYAAHLDWCAENGREPWETKTPRYKACAPVAVWALDTLPGDEAMAALHDASRTNTLRPLVDTTLDG